MRWGHILACNTEGGGDLFRHKNTMKRKSGVTCGSFCVCRLIIVGGGQMQKH